MDLTARRELNNGFGETLARSFEFAVTPTIFAAAGYWLDRQIGTTLVFTIGLLLLALVGTIVRWYFDYEQRMRALDLEHVARRDIRPEAAPPAATRPTTSESDGRLPNGVSLERPDQQAERG